MSKRFIIYTPHQIEENKVGGACSTYGGEERFIEGFSQETCGGRDRFDEQGVDVSITLRWIVWKWDVGERQGLD